MKLSLDLLVAASLGHLKGNRVALLLNHGKMLKVLVGVKKEFTRVELDQDARHRPDVTLLVPRLILEDYFWSAVLASVNNQGVALMRVRGPTKVDNFNLSRIGLIPLSTLLALAGKVTRVIHVATLLASINTALVLHLLQMSS